MNIGNTISRLRKEKGLTQQDFSEKVGLSTTSLSQIELGKKRPQPENLKKICEVLEIPEVLLYFLSFDEKDVPASNLNFYNVMGPALKDMVHKIFKNEQNKVATGE